VSSSPARASAAALPLARALDASPSLAGLLARVRASEARLAAILPALPPELAATLHAGPLDDSAWTLLAEHAAAAAKLRQCLPRVEATLAEQGWPGVAVRIKVRPRA